jgi:uncharacterized protein (TIGR02145 family)
MLPSEVNYRRDCCTFSGWNTKADGTGTTYYAGSYFKHPGGYDNISLYPKWTPNTYTVEFDSQGGSAIDSQTVEHSGRVTEPTPPTRDYCTFIGWYTAPSRYYDNFNAFDFSNRIITSNIKLYASWNYVGKGNDINNYKTVTIGTQIWMAENLDNDVPGSECYNNNYLNANFPNICARYGRFYTWASAMGLEASYNSTTWGGSDIKHQGACPVGWHLPSDAEWQTFKDYVGGEFAAGTKLKSTTGWDSYSGVPAGTDDYGFSALPGGYGRYSDGYFQSAGELGLWWSSTEGGVFGAYDRLGGGVQMSYASEYMEMRGLVKMTPVSVRCVQD